MAENQAVVERSVPEIELIIRASTIDGRRKGACLFCQEYFMDLYLLAELKTISLKVTTVNMMKPPADFRAKFLGGVPPILVDKDVLVTENVEVEKYILLKVPGGQSIFTADREVADMLGKLYTHFKSYIASDKDGVKSAQTRLLAQLKAINDLLEERGTRFLTADTISNFDCELMPRLQHIRVGGRAFHDDFEIPKEYTALWAYIARMYKLDAFIQSCPADQDIVNHLKIQHAVKTCKAELEAPVYTTSIPFDLNGEEDA